MTDAFLDDPDGADAQTPALDPVASWLLKVVLALVVVLLVTTIALVLFLVTLREAPRTVAERDIRAAETAVKEHPETVDGWTKLVYAYASAKRYDDAISTARKGRATTGKNVLLLAEADVLRSAGRYSEALKVYDLADPAVSKAETEAAAAAKKIGIYVPLSDSTLARVYYGRALTKQALDDVSGAIFDLEQAKQLAPQSASVLVLLGDLHAQTGNTDKARESYEAALRFVPDSPEALAGLEKLKKGN